MGKLALVQCIPNCRTAKRLMRYTLSPLDRMILHCMLPCHWHHFCMLLASGYVLSWACLVSLFGFRRMMCDDLHRQLLARRQARLDLQKLKEAEETLRAYSAADTAMPDAETNGHGTAEGEAIFL